MENENKVLTTANKKVDCIPAHKIIGIWESEAYDYFSFWDENDCEDVVGILDSMSNISNPILTGHASGWYWVDGKRGYFYGIAVPLDYHGEIPKGFTVREFPESYYLNFYHPPFDFMNNCEPVVDRVESLAWNYNPKDDGYEWNEEVCQIYQRMLPESVGYEVLRPVKKLV